MAKVGRNDPCPCGSGKKYKKCCEGADRAAPKPPPAPLVGGTVDLTPFLDGATFVEDELDTLSNSVLDLIKEARFDEALEACERLLVEYPEVVDGLDRSAMVHEAKGDLELALDFNRRALAFLERPDNRPGCDEEGLDYFREKIAKLAARVGGASTGRS